MLLGPRLRHTVTHGLLMAVLLAGCADQPTDQDDRSGLGDTFDCMAEAGYDMNAIWPPPTGEVPEDSIWNDEAFNRALVECGRETGNPDRFADPDERAEMTERSVRMTECMRQRGWDIPDPEPEPLFGEFLMPPEIPTPEDAEARAALQRDVEYCTQESGFDYAEE